MNYNDLDLLAEIPSWSDSDAVASLRGEQNIDGTLCSVIDLLPQSGDIAYDRIALWLGRDDLLERQIEFYAEPRQTEPVSGNTAGLDVANSVLEKRIRLGDVHLVGTIPTARRITTETPKAGTHTTIAITAVEFDQGIEDEFFTQRRLEDGP